MTEFPAAEQLRPRRYAKPLTGIRFTCSAALNPATVERHFTWMQQYGLDGVALQRYASAMLPNPRHLKARDIVLGTTCAMLPKTTGGSFSLCMTFTGLKGADLPACNAKDWERLRREGIHPQSRLSSPSRSPLLGIWGLGFNGGISRRDRRKLCWMQWHVRVLPMVG